MCSVCIQGPTDIVGMVRSIVWFFVRPLYSGMIRWRYTLISSVCVQGPTDIVGMVRSIVWFFVRPLYSGMIRWRYTPISSVCIQGPTDIVGMGRSIVWFFVRPLYSGKIIASWLWPLAEGTRSMWIWILTNVNGTVLTVSASTLHQADISSIYVFSRHSMFIF